MTQLSAAPSTPAIASPTQKTRMIVVLLATAVLVAPVARWLWHTGNITDYLVYGAPAGQIPYLFSRLFALLALSLFIMQFSTMLLRRLRVIDAWPLIWHARIGVLLFFCAVLHGTLFIAAKSIRAGHLAWDTLLPSFSHGYYKSMVSLGVLALIGLTLTVVAGVLLRSRGSRSFKRIHYLSIVTGALVLFHCLAVGSEL